MLVMMYQLLIYQYEQIKFEFDPWNFKNTIFTPKLVVHFTNNYKDMASNTELNVIYFFPIIICN